MGAYTPGRRCSRLWLLPRSACCLHTSHPPSLPRAAHLPLSPRSLPPSPPPPPPPPPAARRAHLLPAPAVAVVRDLVRNPDARRGAGGGSGRAGGRCRGRRWAGAMAGVCVCVGGCVGGGAKVGQHVPCTIDEHRLACSLRNGLPFSRCCCSQIKTIDLCRNPRPSRQLPPSSLPPHCCCARQAKTIDLCNNPLTKEPKLQSARRIIAEWPFLNREAEEFTAAVERVQVGSCWKVWMDARSALIACGSCRSPPPPPPPTPSTLASPPPTTPVRLVQRGG